MDDKTSKMRGKNDGIITHICRKIPTLALNKINVMTCKCKDFPTLICSITFYHFNPYFIFKLLTCEHASITFLVIYRHIIILPFASLHDLISSKVTVLSLSRSLCKTLIIPASVLVMYKLAY